MNKKRSFPFVSALLPKRFTSIRTRHTSGRASTKRSHTERNTSQKGWFLISVIVMTLFLTAIGLSVAELTAEQYQHTKLESFDQNAQLVAEAGLEQSVHQLNTDDSFSGYSTTQTFFDNATQGKGVFTTTVTTNADGTSKTIVSTGKIYRNDNATTPYLTRKVRATVVGTGSSGYSVATGPGGLIMSGSAHITNSNVYVNGTIQMSGAAQIGTDSNPSTVYAANYACPTGTNPGSTYPKLCTTTQPISMPNFGSTAIIGTTCGTGQTQSQFPVTGNPNSPTPQIRAGSSGGSGLEAGCTAPAVSEPVYNRSSLTSGMTSSSGTSGTYACSGTKNITLPANTELTGSTVNWGNSCVITISGNVYIPGNLAINGAVQVKVASTVGSTRPVIIVDGTINVGGSAAFIANSSGTGADYVSFANCIGGTNTSCKNGASNPAATPTGTDLYNSQQQQTVVVGGAASSPGMIFDAYWSEVVLSGSGNIGAAAGQTVNMSGAGTVIFGTSLSSGSKTWTITSYQPLY